MTDAWVTPSRALNLLPAPRNASEQEEDRREIGHFLFFKLPVFKLR